MSQSKTDKPLALKTIIGSLLAIVIAYVLFATFSHQVAGNFHNVIYIAGVVILTILFAISSVWAYKQADSANDNLSRSLVVLLAIIFIAWAGGWVAGSNEKVAPGSPQMENVR